jgi:hypothetical protein
MRSTEVYAGIPREMVHGEIILRIKTMSGNPLATPQRVLPVDLLRLFVWIFRGRQGMGAKF